MRNIFVLFTFLLLSICSWAQKTRDMSHEGSSGNVFVGYSLLNGDTLSHASGWEAALTGNFNDWFGLKADLGRNSRTVWTSSTFSSTDCWALLMPALTAVPAAPARAGCSVAAQITT